MRKNKKAFCLALTLAMFATGWAATSVTASNTNTPAKSNPLSALASTGTESQGHGQVHVKKLDVAKYFPKQEGTFVIRDLRTDETYIYNQARAITRQAPESTFKIPNSLIGLQVGAVRDEYQVKQWDGVQRWLPIWNEDHSLASGMRYSVVWFYQAMARDIGEARMQEWLDKINYGNEDISGGIDRFWLNSSLKISPLEEVDFLEKLVEETLPFDKPVMKTVKRMMIQDEQDTYTLYGKTGTRETPPVGWYVGFVENERGTYVFATNVDGEGTASSAKAKEITLGILKENHIIQE
ncbi:class D beta-lactamase [Brevibacillus dissolubilis]|uniref:class D beta-lactamase n=1 Tax=Brevibacillus dissolubilis TaxID=1844116 RepID=UPI0021001F46|nr:class D beta-lactamase [Brevibacillus dissolubilis]